MAKISDDINFTAKMIESYSKQHDLILKSLSSSLLQCNELLSTMSASVSKAIQYSIPSSLQLFIDEVNKIYQPIINSDVFHIDDLIPKFDLLLNNLSESLNKIDYEKCSDEDISILAKKKSEIQEITTSQTHKHLTWEQWIVILTFIMQIINFAKDFLPDEQVKQLTTEVQSIATSFDDYIQQSLHNQELYLEKIDKLIENQEHQNKILEKVD